MAFIDRVLQEPTYGWKDEKGELIKPTPKQIVNELLSRINIFKSKKNWAALIGWFWVMCLIPFAAVFFIYLFNIWFFILGFIYCMMIMSTHGTIWYHRYGTHQAFKFSNNFWRFITQNLVLKVIPEEVYIVSHHVHHSKSDEPGDPYNAYAGFLYCYLADTNHQQISKNMDEADYNRTVALVKHTGIKINTYAQYQKWGSVGNPYSTLIHWVLNWAFWYAAFYFIGGHSLATALFTGAAIWVAGVRTFNYYGHGKGKGAEVQKDGMDFNRKDMSINQIRPGLLSGEWHNNHHLYPSSARSGFLPYQIDLAWVYVWVLSKIGGVSSYHDSKNSFLKDYYYPYLEKLKAAK